jgi:hypothetical protein
LAILTQAFKLPADAGLPLQPPFEFYLTAPHQVEGVPLGFFEVRIYTDGLSELCASPALRESQGALIADKSRAKFHIAAFLGFHRVTEAGDSLSGNVGLQARQLARERGRDVINQHGMKGHAGVIRKLECNH